MENVSSSDGSQFLLHLKDRVRLRCKNMKAWIHSALHQWGCWCNKVGDIYLAKFGSLSTNWASFKCHSLSIAAHRVHHFMTTVYPSSDESCVMSQCSNDLKLFTWTWQWVHCTLMASSHQIPVQESPSGMWWRFSSRMCSWQICISCVILSCQYGPKLCEKCF